MRHIFAKNVNYAFVEGITLIGKYHIEVAPRGMKTFEFDSPVVTQYQFPCECILFNRFRQINPFFHFFESLWILAGRNDVEFLRQFNEKVVDFSDNGGQFHGAYGYRLRKLERIVIPSYKRTIIDTITIKRDQLVEIVKLLKRDPSSRQGVLQIWDPIIDLNVESSDIPCNTTAYFKIRGNYLNMSVFCRSNDLIWGAYGTDCVQFSTIQQYLAMKLGLSVGTYHHWSDSLHVYIERPDWELYSSMAECGRLLAEDPYLTGDIIPRYIIGDADQFDLDMELFFHIWKELCANIDHIYGINLCPGPMRNDNYEWYHDLIDRFDHPYFRTAVIPMFVMWRYHLCWKKYGKLPKHHTPIKDLLYSHDDLRCDWILAAVRWLFKKEHKEVLHVDDWIYSSNYRNNFLV